MSMMPIEHIADWEQRIARQDAFWQREIIDRPVVAMTVRRSDRPWPYPKPKKWSSLAERWMDGEYVAEWNLARVMNTDYLGDALPKACPNLGPDIFAAFLGSELEFGERTSWSQPLLADWPDPDHIALREDNFYWQKVREMTDILLEVGRGRFYTGITDLHVGGDALAALRGTETLSIDLIERPEDVKALLGRITAICRQVMDFYYDKLGASGQAFSTWMGLVSSRKWYVPSNDFSCMISSSMFDEIFLPGITEECRYLENSIYHLDGAGALHHLDSLLAIEELDAVQWVWGAGRGRASDWLPVFQRCQAAKKGIWVSAGVGELDLLMENLRPEGVWLSLGGVSDREQGEEVLKRVARWR